MTPEAADHQSPPEPDGGPQPTGPDPARPAGKSDGVGSLLAVPEPKNFIDKIPVAGFVYRLYRGYSRRNGPLLSAGVAYYALFSMGPLILLTLQITGLLFGGGPPVPQTRLLSALEPYIGEDLAAMLATLVGQIDESEGYAFAIVNLGILLYGATRLFVRLQASFNLMWDIRVASREYSGRRVVSRLLVFGMILIPTLLLIVGLVLGTAFTWLEHLLDASGILITLGQTLIPFVICWLALIVVFVVLPDIKLSLRDCWFTTFLVAVAWGVGTYIFGRYLSWSGDQKYAGAVGALIGVILWVDVLSIITLVGVRFNKALYLWRGKVIQPYDYAALIGELPAGEAPAKPPDAG